MKKVFLLHFITSRSRNLINGKGLPKKVGQPFSIFHTTRFTGFYGI